MKMVKKWTRRRNLDKYVHKAARHCGQSLTYCGEIQRAIEADRYYTEMDGEESIICWMERIDKMAKDIQKIVSATKAVSRKRKKAWEQKILKDI